VAYPRAWEALQGLYGDLTRRNYIRIRARIEGVGWLAEHWETVVGAVLVVLPVTGAGLWLVIARGEHRKPPGDRRM